MQNNLGVALLRFGERESGTVRLEEAVAAFRAALEERTRERVSLDWAATQLNLGLALARLGERESGTVRLEEAAAAWEMSLTILADSWPPELVEELRAIRNETMAEIAARRSAAEKHLFEI
jgi:exonuclease VII small subunit